MRSGSSSQLLRSLRVISIAHISFVVAVLMPTAVLAHASDRGHVLLLPTGYYVAGGAFAVAASFLVLALLPPDLLERLWRKRLALFHWTDKFRPFISLISFACLAVLLAAGVFGSRDPLSNPLPLTIWTLMWVGLTLLHGLFGNLWASLNPWYGPFWLFTRLTGISNRKVRFPEWLGCWPAVVLLFAFAWFELVDPAPDDPERLAYAAGFYWSATFIAMLLFGYEDWSRRGEFLSVFFAIVSRFAPLERSEDKRIRLCLPGARLLNAPALDAGGVAFILLALSSVSFDGFSKTFVWLGANDINPLEFPGRTALIGINSAGLLTGFILLASIFLIAIGMGQKMARDSSRLFAGTGLLVWSIVPIALAYHVAHYLTSLLVDGQYAIAALSDPFGRGWNLFGTAQMQIEAGIIAGADSAWVLWNIQAGAIIAGHILAVLVAHLLAFRLYPDPSKATISQFPLTVLMIGYTIFGLWLLATPTAG